jgi:UDP-N-acetylenolpyruvoylglucosamine reductase
MKKTQNTRCYERYFAIVCKSVNSHSVTGKYRTVGGEESTLTSSDSKFSSHHYFTVSLLYLPNNHFIDIFYRLGSSSCQSRL